MYLNVMFHDLFSGTVITFYPHSIKIMDYFFYNLVISLLTNTLKPLFVYSCNIF